MKRLISVALCMTLLGCGESQQEKNLRTAKEAREKVEKEIAAAKIAAEKEAARLKAEAEAAQAKARAEREKAEAEAALKRKKEQEEIERRKAEIEKERKEAERRKPRSVYTLSPDERKRFDKFGGFVLGETWSGVPDADPRDPMPFARKVQLDAAFDVFAKANATIFYTPATKKAAYLKTVVEKPAAQRDDEEGERLLKAFKLYYDVEFCFFDQQQYVIRDYEQATYDSREGLCADKKEATYGYCNAVDDKVLSVRYEFDDEKKVARYTVYAMNTNLCNLLNIEAQQLQERAIDEEMKNSQKTLKSFCGVSLGSKIDIDSSWGAGDAIKREMKYTAERREEKTWTEAKSPRATVKCNVFRQFRKNAEVHVSPQSKTAYRIEIETDSLKTGDIDSRNLWNEEYANTLLTIGGKYETKPYKLVYGNKYRQDGVLALCRKEQLFVCGDTLLYVSLIQNGGKKIVMTCIDMKRADDAVAEYENMKLAKKREGEELLFDGQLAGGKLSTFYGIGLGQKLVKGRLITSIEKSPRQKCMTAMIPSDGQKSFRGFTGIGEVWATWQSQKIYCIQLKTFRSGSWGDFTNAQEIENINALLAWKLGVKPTVRETKYGRIYAYACPSDVVVELEIGSDGYIDSLSAKDLTLERLAKKEYDLENQEQSANKVGGESAL